MGMTLEQIQADTLAKASKELEASKEEVKTESKKAG